MGTTGKDFQVRPIAAAEIPAALELFKRSGRKSDWETLFALMLENQLAESGLFVADQHGEIVGTVWGTLVTHTMAQIVAPACKESGSDSNPIEIALLNATMEYLGSTGAEFASCAIETSDRHDASLKAAGFQFAANIQSMVKPIFPTEKTDDLDLHSESTLSFRRPNNSEDLAALITETYKGSLDCQIVNDHRTAADFLESYSIATDANQDGWFVASHQGSDVGCILVNQSGKQAEIAYMGVVANSRGNGYGRRLLTLAHHYVAQHGVTLMTVDVDSRNTYAIDIYQKAGYVAYDFSRVYVATILHR